MLFRSQERIRKLADWAGERFDFTDASTRRNSAFKLVDTIARKSTIHVLESLRDFARMENRKLMVLLSWSAGAVNNACSGLAKKPADLALVKWLEEQGIPHVDSLDAHTRDFAHFHLTTKEYLARYYSGHYTPQGNQFFAYAIKSAVVDWLDPKPPAYRGSGAVLDFRDGKYLEK